MAVPNREDYEVKFVTAVSCEVEDFGVVEVIVQSVSPTGVVGSELVQETAARLGRELRECAEGMSPEAVRGFSLMRDLATNATGRRYLSENGEGDESED